MIRFLCVLLCSVTEYAMIIAAGYVYCERGGLVWQMLPLVLFAPLAGAAYLVLPFND